LPEGVDDERAEATCKHGLLTVRIPWRREAGQRSHRLTVLVE
jgi:HSP20 family protein